MVYFERKDAGETGMPKSKKKKIWIKILLGAVVILAIIGGFFAWKTGNVLNKISSGKSSLLGNIVRSIPGVDNKLKGEEDGRINMLLLGMRGENVPGGGLLADTIILVSIKPAENKVAMLSIPRDLFVKNPGWGNQTKINAVYAAGEENGKKQGLEDMKTVVGEITGLPIHYATSINFEGFKKLIDVVGGVPVHLDQPFTELLQFRGLEQRCDGNVFTIPSGNYEEKRIQRKNGTYYANPKRYPLCFARELTENLECGGSFELPAGDITLNGEKALCYVRARVTSSDFERAKRQQVVLSSLKDRFISIGTLTDITKVNEILNVLGNNVRTDLEGWEMKRMLELYQQQQIGSNPQIYQRVLENSEEGLLYHPEQTSPEVGYILLPLGDNYDRIHQLAADIFTIAPQSDIKPK